MRIAPYSLWSGPGRRSLLVGLFGATAASTLVVPTAPNSWKAVCRAKCRGCRGLVRPAPGHFIGAYTHSAARVTRWTINSPISVRPLIP